MNAFNCNDHIRAGHLHWKGYLICMMVNKSHCNGPMSFHWILWTSHYWLGGSSQSGYFSLCLLGRRRLVCQHHPLLSPIRSRTFHQHQHPKWAWYVWILCSGFCFNFASVICRVSANLLFSNSMVCKPWTANLCFPATWIEECAHPSWRSAESKGGNSAWCWEVSQPNITCVLYWQINWRLNGDFYADALWKTKKRDTFIIMVQALQTCQYEEYIYCTISDPIRFEIDLGRSADDLALHFNPRFRDDTDGAVIVCNSKAAGCWGDEKREINNPLQRGADVKVRRSDSREGGCVMGQFTQITRNTLLPLLVCR